MSGQDRRDDLRDEIRAQIDGAKAQFDEASARIEKKAGRNLFLAIGTGLVFAAVFLFFCSLAYPLQNTIKL